jgi:enoyl-CoA hydratase/carnithine racemase
VLRVERRGEIAWLTFDRPEKLNAMTRQLWQELQDALLLVAGDAGVRAVILSGAGRAFSVGGDIAGFKDLRSAADRRAYVHEAFDALLAIERCPKPTIAAVHGYALGGGCELTMMCDVVVADETAQFGMPESAVGLVPGLGILRGGAQLNLHWLKYLIFTGASLGAEEARLAGLVQAVVPAGKHLEQAELWAKQIALRSPLALATAKAFFSSGASARYADAVDVVTTLQGSDDMSEGIAAYLERRAPTFQST